jgi:hypothetical protein
MVVGALSAAAVFDVGSAAADPSVSQFAGSWTGTWTLPVHDEAGTFDWTISDQGRITGRVNDDGAIVGHVRADGRLVFVGYAPNDVAAKGFNGFPFQGTAEIDDEDRLVVATPHPQGIHLLEAVLERK